jgi:hypothetical protein
MSIDFTCPECREKSTVGPEFAGRYGTCAFCGAQVIVPESSGVATAVAPPPVPARTSSSTPWVVILAVVCVGFLLCGGVLVALLLPAVNAAKREEGRRAMCSNNLKQFSFALLMYEEKYGHLPPASGGTKGRPMSWRVAILPFMERNDFYQQYRQDERRDSANNLALVKRMPREFRCPSDDEAGEGETSYVMITGKNTVGGSPGSSGLNLSHINGGHSNMIMVLEVHGLKISWTEPRDITLDELLQRLNASGGHIGHVATFNVGMADGSVASEPATIDPSTLRRLATINGNKSVDVENDGPESDLD